MSASTLYRSHDDSASDSGPSWQSEATESREPSSASKRYASAPFLLQGQHGRRNLASELVVVETPPSHRVNPTLTTRTPPLQLNSKQLPQLQQPQKQQAVISATLPSPTAARHAPTHRPSLSPNTNGVTLPQTLLLRDLRAPSEASSGIASSDATPLTTASAPSLIYTWTDSYLDESPEATRARWLTRQTFGPVLQSEGGSSSTVASTPRMPRQCGEEVWGGVLDRNARERGGRGFDGIRARNDTQLNTVTATTTTGGGGGAGVNGRQRRYNLEAAERGGEGLGRCTAPPQATAHHGDLYAREEGGCADTEPSSAARALFSATGNDVSKEGLADMHAPPQHLISDVSTVMATVQQPRRVGLIASVERAASLATGAAANTQPAFHPAYSYENDGGLNDNNNNNNNHSVKLSDSVTHLVATLPPNTPELRSVRDAEPSRPLTVASGGLEGASAAGGVNGPDPAPRQTARQRRTSRSSSLCENTQGDVGEASGSDVMRGNVRASRNGPLRMRVLKPLYDE